MLAGRVMSRVRDLHCERFMIQGFGSVGVFG
jgi:hypothetical protein